MNEPYAVVLVSPGFDLGTGYHHRAIRDRQAIESCGLPCRIVNTRDITQALRRLRLPTLFRLVREIRSASLLVSENYGALFVHLLVAGWTVSLRQRGAFVVHGSLTELAEYRFGAFKYPLYRLCERVMIPRLACTLCVSEVMAEAYRSLYPEARDRIWCSPNLPPPTFYQAVRTARLRGRREIRRELGLPENGVVLLYAGNLQAWQGIGLLTRVARGLLSQSSEARVVCLTTDVPGLTRAMEDAGVDPLRISVKTVPNAEIPPYLVAADWLYAVRERNEINRVSCPTKAVEYLISGGWLVVSDELGDISGIVRDSGMGLVVDDELSDDPDRLAAMLIDHADAGVFREAVPQPLPPTLLPDHTARLFSTILAGNP